MQIRGIDFGSVLGASGVQGFFGEGYPYHKYLKFLGLNFSGMTLVAKTTTLEPRMDPAKKLGNMPLDPWTLAPTERFPKCIYVDYRRGLALNAVGLSGPGAKALLARGEWQRLEKPFFISFMSLEQTPEGKLTEFSKFVQLIHMARRDFRTSFGFQINFSCPNVGMNVIPENQFVYEALDALKLAAFLQIPLMPKFSITTEPETVARICESPFCDAICVSNTVPWRALPDKIDWDGLFGKDAESPLAKFGGGGLSGRPLHPFVVNWVRRLRTLGVKTLINAGGGILSPTDVDALREAGANSVFIGSMAFLRPWNVQRTIQRANLVFAGR